MLWNVSTRRDMVLSANVNAIKDQVLLLPTSADIVLARMEGKLHRICHRITTVDEQYSAILLTLQFYF